MDLAFAHFSSELLLKEQMIIPVKKKRSPTLVISTQNWLILAKFAKKNPPKSAVVYWLFLGELSPPKFPVKSADFSKNLLLKILRKLTFFLLKSRKIGRFFREVAPENPVKFCFFFREISEALFLMTHAQAFSLFTKSCI